jgi:hypothetical protein
VTQLGHEPVPAGQAASSRAPVPYGPGVRIRIQAGTLMQKLLPPHLVEPYLSTQRSVMSGFVHRSEDDMLPGPSWLREAHDAGTLAGAHAGKSDDLWVLRWRALDIQTYLAASPAPPDAEREPAPWSEPYGRFVHPAFELFIAPGPIPVGTEMYRITPGGEEFVARYDGQGWLRAGAGG